MFSLRPIRPQFDFIAFDLAKIVISCIIGSLLRKRLEQAGVLKLKEA